MGYDDHTGELPMRRIGNGSTSETWVWSVVLTFLWIIATASDLAARALSLTMQELDYA